MPKKYRLSHADLVKISRLKSERTHGLSFSLTITRFPEGGGPKMACVVSKKIAARAVDRNKIQRRCREIVRPHIEHTNQALALVFYAKRGAAAASFVDTEKDIQGLLARAGVLA